MCRHQMIPPSVLEGSEVFHRILNCSLPLSVCQFPLSLHYHHLSTMIQGVSHPLTELVEIHH